MLQSVKSSQAHPFIAVHAGAGYHSDSSSRELTALCRSACRKAMVALDNSADASEGIAVAISELENNPLTNAGLGSNLSLTGQVECDASIMTGAGEFGAVGAIQGVVNPVRVAQAMLEESSRGCLPLGRVPPLMLAGEGARLWARQHNCTLCSPDYLLTDRAKEVYIEHKSRLDTVSLPPSKKPRIENSTDCCTTRLDTVGAICVDSKGGVAGGVSSGGISLKFPGRVGQAAVFGCGCWAGDGNNTGNVASSTSELVYYRTGTGEYIMKTLLARESALSMVDSTLGHALTKHFLESERLAKVEQSLKLAGVIALHHSTQGNVHFSWAHTTESMCVGYMSSWQREPTALISKMEDPDKAGWTVHEQAINLSPSIVDD